MSYKKTAISLDEALLEQVDSLADELKVSRSRLFVMAVEELLQRHENRKLLQALNAAYNDAPDPEEEAQLREMLVHHRALVEEEW